MKCPGQDTRFWTPDDVYEISCARCGKPVEFFKTDPHRRCHYCGARVVNPKVALGCAQWCNYAKDCLGFDPKNAPSETPGQSTLVDQLINAVKETLGDDHHHFAHTLATLEWVEELLPVEAANPQIVIAATLLHHVDIPQTNRQKEAGADEPQTEQNSSKARQIMEQLDMDRTIIDQVLHLIGPVAETDSVESRIIQDALGLAQLQEELKQNDHRASERIIDETFQTKAGQHKARQLLRKTKKNGTTEERK